MNLHKHLPDLRFFIMMSSSAGVSSLLDMNLLR
jgi:hypothetical protein